MTDLNYKVVLLGDGYVGKTSIRRVYMGERFNTSHMMTLGADFSEKNVEIMHNNEMYNVTLQIWDIAGQTQFASLMKRFMENTDIVMLVFDLTRHETFTGLNTWLKIAQEANDGRHLPILIIGNKLDLVNERSITDLELQKYIERLAINYSGRVNMLLTSALTGENIDKGFEIIVRNLLDLQFS